MIPYNQLSLADIFSDCQKIYESDKPQFLSLLQQHIDLDEIVPVSFRKHFYASTGRTRKYPLNAFLWALIIQRIFSIPTDSLLLVSFSIPGISVNSVVSTRFRMPLRSPVSSRIFLKIYRLFSTTLLILRNQSVRQSILPRQL